MALIFEDAIAKAFKKSTIRIQGRFDAKGKDLKSSIDTTESLTVTL
jgi:hypothetical protein